MQAHVWIWGLWIWGRPINYRSDLWCRGSREICSNCNTTQRFLWHGAVHGISFWWKMWVQLGSSTQTHQWRCLGRSACTCAWCLTSCYTQCRYSHCCWWSLECNSAHLKVSTCLTITVLHWTQFSSLSILLCLKVSSTPGASPTQL